MIFLARKYKQKPRQWGPAATVRSAVRDWFERRGMPAPLAYYPLWEGAGSTAGNIIGSAPDGTVYGATWSRGGTLHNDDTDRVYVEQQVPSEFSIVISFRKDTGNIGYALGYRPYIYLSTSYCRFRVNGTNIHPGSNPLIVGADQTTAGTYDGTTSRFYFDGQEVGSASDSAPGSSYFILGCDTNGGTYELEGVIYQSLLFDSALSADQISALHADPYGAIQPRSFPVYFLVKAPSATDYTLTCEGGSYVVTGTDADLLSAKQVSAEGGAYVVNGTTASLLRNYVEQADGGSYNLTGTDAAFSRDYNLSAVDGAYNLTGTASTLIKDSSLLCSGGSYNLTGTSANLLRLFQLAADSGTYTLNGQPVDLFKTSSLAAEGGTYSITGTAADLLIGRILQAAAGLYSLTGSDVTLTYTPAASYTLTADSGMFEISGAATELLKFYTTHCEPGTYTLTGQDASLLLQHILTAGAGSYILTGASANLIKQLFLQANSGTYAISGMDAVLTYTTTGLAQGLVSITFTLKQPTAAFNLTQPTATFNLKQPTITFTN